MGNSVQIHSFSLTRCVQQALALSIVLFAGASLASDPALPLKSGKYTFQHRYAEHPTMASIRLRVTIKGHHIVITNPKTSQVFPAGVLAEGELVWHAASQQWIIAEDAEDRHAEDVGGCSAGPDVVDLVHKIYWTC